MKSRTGLVYAALIFTTFFWSSNIVIGRAVNASIEPLELSFWRWLFASVMLVPFSVAHVRADWISIKSHIGILALLSLLGVSLFNSILYFSTHTTGATNIALIQTTMPVFVVIFNFVLFRRGVRAGALLGVCLGLCGALIVIFKGQFTEINNLRFTIGDISMLVAVMLYGLYSVLLIKAPNIHPFSLLTVTVVLGTVMLFPFFLLQVAIDNRIAISFDLMPSILYIAFFPSIVAYWSWNYGVRSIGAGSTGLFICFIPIFTAILAAIFLNEMLHAYHVIGLMLVVSGIVIMQRFRNGY